MFYEQKKFWSLKDYMLRTRNGIERKLNLQSLTCALMELLPRLDFSFSFLEGKSRQEARFLLGQVVDKMVFFTVLASKPETEKMNIPIKDIYTKYINHLIRAS